MMLPSFLPWCHSGRPQGRIPSLWGYPKSAPLRADGLPGGLITRLAARRDHPAFGKIRLKNV